MATLVADDIDNSFGVTYLLTQLGHLTASVATVAADCIEYGFGVIFPLMQAT